MDHVTTHLIAMRAYVADLHEGEDGFSTAELLGNAALGIVALVAIWAGLSAIGVDVMTLVRNEAGLPAN